MHTLHAIIVNQLHLIQYADNLEYRCVNFSFFIQFDFEMLLLIITTPAF